MIYVRVEYFPISLDLLPHLENEIRLAYVQIYVSMEITDLANL